MDPDVPLVVHEVNGEALRNHKGIIAIQTVLQFKWLVL